jgi:hypothetical protein
VVVDSCNRINGSREIAIARRWTGGSVWLCWVASVNIELGITADASSNPGSIAVATDATVIREGGDLFWTAIVNCP